MFVFFLLLFSKCGKNHAIYYFAVRVERVCVCVDSRNRIFSVVTRNLVQMKIFLYTTKLITKGTYKIVILSVFFFSLCFSALESKFECMAQIEHFTGECIDTN